MLNYKWFQGYCLVIFFDVHDKLLANLFIVFWVLLVVAELAKNLLETSISFSTPLM